MDGAIVVDKDVTRIHRAAVHLMPDHTHPLRGDRHPAPHRRPGRRADRPPGDLGVAVDADHRRVRRRHPPRARGLRPDPVPRQPGAGHARALQAPARRGLQHPVRARDRGPRHRARRRRGRPAARDGHPDRPRDRGLRARARHRRPAALPAARGAGHRRRRRARAGRSATTCQPAPARTTREALLASLEPCSPTELVDPAAVAARARASAAASTSTAPSPPRATGCWPRCPACPRRVVDRLVEHFGTLQKLLSAGVDDLQVVDGVGELRARSVREGLSRLAESSILERYV